MVSKNKYALFRTVLTKNKVTLIFNKLYYKKFE